MDPRNPACLFELARDVVNLRGYREAQPLLQRAIALDPESTIYPKFLALVGELVGDPDAGLGAIEAAPASVRSDPGLQFTKAELLYFKRDYDGARGVLRALTPGNDRTLPWEMETLAGDVERADGNADAARAHYAKALSLIQGALKQPGHATGRIHYELADIYAGLGRRAEALEEGRQGVRAEQDAMSISRTYYAEGRLAQIAAKIADTGTSVTTLDTLLAAPAGFAVSVEFIRRHPAFDSIRSDPGFQALLKKYESPPPR
jgi:tetratricopeptide (TPR) repeat protein